MQQIEINKDDLLFVSTKDHDLITGMPVRVTVVKPGMVQAVDSNGNIRVFNRNIFTFKKAKEIKNEKEETRVAVNSSDCPARGQTSSDKPSCVGS